MLAFSEACNIEGAWDSYTEYSRQLQRVAVKLVRYTMSY
jgi:hypothetical protein